MTENVLENIKENSTIKSIDVDDFDLMAGGRGIPQEALDTNGLVDMNNNEKILVGKAIEEIDDMIKATKFNSPKNLKEAVIHECGHAKAYYKKSNRGSGSSAKSW